MKKNIQGAINTAFVPYMLHLVFVCLEFMHLHCILFHCLFHCHLCGYALDVKVLFLNLFF
jgi:hypothetical protein